MKKSTPATAKNQKRILIVAGESVVRAGLRSFIEPQEEWTVCGEAESSQAALAAVERLQPHLAIIDLSLENSHGLDLIKNLRTPHPNLLILVYSTHEEQLYAERVLRAGGHGYLEKKHGAECVREAVRRILANELSFSPAIVKQVCQSRPVPVKSGASSVPRLSDREAQVFQLMGQGFSAKEMAHRLLASPKTIEVHRRHIQNKLHLPNGQAAYRWAVMSSLENQPAGQTVLSFAAA